MIFVEQDDERFGSLQAEIASFWRAGGGQPGNVKVWTEHGTFDETATSILDSLDQKGRTIAPTFAFIDPFGWKGVPLTTIGRLLANDRTEVFFNFMYDSLNRWVSHPDDPVHVHLGDLFGCHRYRDADGLPPAGRRQFLHDLYRSQLEAAGCRYVRHFEMFNDKGRLTYSLFFGTKHVKGLEVMKDAMWSVDPAAGIGFSDRLADRPVLFEPEPDFRPLRDAILSEFGGREASIEQIHRFVIVDTPYKASHYKKQVLKDLQVEGLLTPVSGQQRAGTFPDGTLLRVQ